MFFYVMIAFIITLIVVCTIALIYLLMWYIQRQARLDNELLCKVTNQYRGTYLERRLVLKLLKNGIPEVTIFHDLYVPIYRGRYAQIDLLVVTSVGIIVIEVKDFGGWIFGNGKQQNWTQVLSYGEEKHRFYNPILQNENHIKAIRNLTYQFGQIPYYNIIVFSNRCRLKDVSNIPNNTIVTYSGNLISVINQIKQTYPIANYTNKREVIDTLKRCVELGTNNDIVSNHIKNIKDRFGKAMSLLC